MDFEYQTIKQLYGGAKYRALLSTFYNSDAYGNLSLQGLENNESDESRLRALLNMDYNYFPSKKTYETWEFIKNPNRDCINEIGYAEKVGKILGYRKRKHFDLKHELDASFVRKAHESFQEAAVVYSEYVNSPLEDANRSVYNQTLTLSGNEIDIIFNHNLEANEIMMEILTCTEDFNYIRKAILEGKKLCPKDKKKSEAILNRLRTLFVNIRNYFSTEDDSIGIRNSSGDMISTAFEKLTIFIKATKDYKNPDGTINFVALEKEEDFVTEQNIQEGIHLFNAIHPLYMQFLMTNMLVENGVRLVLRRNLLGGLDDFPRYLYFPRETGRNIEGFMVQHTPFNCSKLGLFPLHSYVFSVAINQDAFWIGDSVSEKFRLSCEFGTNFMEPLKNLFNNSYLKDALAHKMLKMFSIYMQ